MRREQLKHFAEELELLRGMSWWDRQRAMITDKELMDIASQVKSAQQMKTMSRYFSKRINV